MVWDVTVDMTILHIFLSKPACTDMVYSKELECDVTTIVMAKAILRHDWFHFFTSERRIRAVMYMPCVKSSCSELKLAKHLHTFFVLTKN